MSPAFTLRQLELFVNTAVAGTISGAAKISHTSQTAVSLAISELEKHLGVQLLIRQRAKGVVLTDTGASLLLRAERILTQAQELQEAANEVREIASGNVTFGCLQTLSPLIIPKLLSTSTKRYPELNLALLEASTEELISSLRSGQCDIAMFYTSTAIPDLDCTVIGEYAPYALISTEHPLSNEQSIALRDLEEYPLITPMSSSSIYDSEAVLRSAGIEPRVLTRSANLEVVRALVARNLGFSILVQKWPYDESYEKKPLRALEIKDEVPPARLVVANAAIGRLSYRLQVIRSLCVQIFDTEDLPYKMESN